MNSNTTIFEDVNVRNSNARTFMIFHIDDTTWFASIFTSKLLFKFENFSKIKSTASTKAQTKKQMKEKNSKKKEKKNFEKTIEKRADE